MQKTFKDADGNTVVVFGDGEELPDNENDLEEHQLPIDDITTFVHPDQDPAPFLDLLKKAIKDED